MLQNVYTLLCQKDMQMASVTIPKILQFLEPGQLFLILDDGSLTLSSMNMLKQLSPLVKVISREDREDIIMSKLAKYPNCQHYRNIMPLAFKLIDIPLLVKNSQGSTRYTFTDSDIIYIKNCSDYFNRQQNTYLLADRTALSVRIKKVFFRYNWKIPINFNSGYFSYDTIDYDLDFVEYYLGLPDVFDFPWLTEQTCWAILFGKSGPSFNTLEYQFVCREKFSGPKLNTLAVHLIVNLKNMYNEWSNIKDHSDLHFKVPVFTMSRNFNVFDWIGKAIRRLFL